MNFVIPCFIMLTSATFVGTGRPVMVNANKVSQITTSTMSKYTRIEFTTKWDVEVMETPVVIKERMKKECQ